MCPLDWLASWWTTGDLEDVGFQSVLAVKADGRIGRGGRPRNV